MLIPTLVSSIVLLLFVLLIVLSYKQNKKDFLVSYYLFSITSLLWVILFNLNDGSWGYLGLVILAMMMSLLLIVIALIWMLVVYLKHKPKDSDLEIK